MNTMKIITKSGTVLISGIYLMAVVALSMFIFVSSTSAFSRQDAEDAASSQGDYSQGKVPSPSPSPYSEYGLQEDVPARNNEKSSSDEIRAEILYPASVGVAVVALVGGALWFWPKKK